MTDSKPKHAPDSLKYQWRLLGLVLRADWATGLDKSVAYEVVDNYRKERKDSRASLRYLEKATGATRSNIIASLRRLVEHGPFSVALQGGGTRPTAYALHFDKVAENASGIVGDTASDNGPGGIVGNTTVVSQAIPLEDASGIVDNTESVLLVDGLQAGLLDRMNDCAAATPPPVSGLSAATAETPQEGKPTFESLWRAYDYAKGKKEARAAWNALPPDTNLAAVIEAAKAWQASWAAQGKPDAPRYTLARWLKDERFDEDAPRGFQKVEKPAKPRPAKIHKPAQSSHSFPAGETKLTIATAEVVQTETTSTLVLAATDDTGAEYSHSFAIECHKPDVQAAGQKELSEIVDAAGFLFGIEDAKQLAGRHVVALVDEGQLSWHPPRAGQPKQPEPTVIERPKPVRQVCNEPWPEWMETEAPTPAPAPKPPKPKFVRKEISKEEEQRRLREWIADGLFDDDEAA
jgi:hypothetical protein